jgi:hypothetical protein
MLQIRKNTFETNSSSTHAFVIDTRTDVDKYTDNHLEAFTEHIMPFTSGEIGMLPDPFILTDLKDKVRYLWTVYTRNNFYDSSRTDSASEFMGRVQSLLPQAVFCFKFATSEKAFAGNYYAVDDVAYLEDSDYVMNDYYGHDITNWDTEQIKRWLLDGAVIFGDRDRLDITGNSLIESIYEQSYYERLLSVSG